MTTYYPLADPHPGRGMLRAKRTGERRFVRAGEWYLSGAIPAAYRAPADLPLVTDIVTIVRLRAATTYTEDPTE